MWHDALASGGTTTTESSRLPPATMANPPRIAHGNLPHLDSERSNGQAFHPPCFSQE
jgi:hypothetical protein